MHWEKLDNEVKVNNLCDQLSEDFLHYELLKLQEQSSAVQQFGNYMQIATEWKKKNNYWPLKNISSK